MSEQWFWVFNVLIMEGSNATPLGVAKWAIDKAQTSTIYAAMTMIEWHAKDESKRQFAYRPARWIAVMPLNAEPRELNLSVMAEFYRGDRIARGSMLRSKEAKPTLVEFQLLLW